MGSVNNFPDCLIFLEMQSDSDDSQTLNFNFQGIGTDDHHFAVNFRALCNQSQLHYFTIDA